MILLMLCQTGFPGTCNLCRAYRPQCCNCWCLHYPHNVWQSGVSTSSGRKLRSCARSLFVEKLPSWPLAWKQTIYITYSKVHVANKGPAWGWQDHIVSMNLAIRDDKASSLMNNEPASNKETIKCTWKVVQKRCGNVSIWRRHHNYHMYYINVSAS